MNSTRCCWLVVLVLGALASVANAASNTTFRVMTYNIHHGEGLDGKLDLERIATVITNAGADLVGLQEVDRGVTRTQRRDLPAELAKLTGMAVVFSNNYSFQGGEYGNAVLSRFPVLSATNTHYRMVRPGEQRGLLQATVQVAGRPLIFAVTHIDHRADDTERLTNVVEIHGLFPAPNSLPVLLCGDFNDTPGSRTQIRLKERFMDAWEAVGQGTGFTHPSDQPRKRIDYQWISRGAPLRPTKAWIPATTASDHAPLVIEWEWP
jgi:endonuclease/exonuclease/phosphatase family metal-dependent hydrolase